MYLECKSLKNHTDNFQAILSAFGVLLPTACYLGFDPMNDPTRPLTTNVVVGDGCNFKFASYQLNKTELVDAGKEEQVLFLIIFLINC